MLIDSVLGKIRLPYRILGTSEAALEAWRILHLLLDGRLW